MQLFKCGEYIIYTTGIAVVDRSDILEHHPQITNIRTQLASVARIKEIEAKNAANMEYDTNKKTQVVQSKRNELSEEEQKLMTPIYRDCERAVRNIARRKGFSIVIDKFVVLIGAEDITEEVNQELKRIN